MGLLPYRQRLHRLRLAILPECRWRGDLIETMKIMNGLVDYGQNMFRKKSAYQTHNLPVISSHSLRSAHDFFSNRFIKYCNQLAYAVWCSASINASKAGLNRFKSSKPDSNGFWELSKQIFNGISEKSDHVNYSLANHDVAMQQNDLF